MACSYCLRYLIFDAVTLRRLSLRLPRIQVIARDLAYWLAWFDKHPHERFISDGDPATITVPADLRDKLKPDLKLRVIETPDR